MPLIVSDIDGTVFTYGKPVKKVIDYIKKNSEEVIFLTNRPDTERRKTVEDLKLVGIKYIRLIMNSSGQSAPVFKKAAIQDIIEDGFDVTEFIDDRADTRQAVSTIKGVKVTDPAKITGSKNETLASYNFMEKMSITVENIIIAGDKANESLANFVDLLAADSAKKINVPQFIKDNAKRGLELNRKGFGGDGLTDKTKAEARDMADGKISLGKCVRMAAWFARHKVDTTTDGFKNTKSKDYPSAGLVAWLLWGGDSNGSMRAADWASKQVEQFSQEK